MALVRQFRPDGSSYVVISETSASNAITPGSNNASQTPDAESCLAHLRLLEAFFRLREEISQRDGLFGLRDSFAGSTIDEERNHTLARIREKRWVIYVTKAAIRFEKWWDHCVQKGRPEHGHNMIAKTPPRQFSVDNIPPLGKLLTHVGPARLIFLQTLFWFGTHFSLVQDPSLRTASNLVWWISGKQDFPGKQSRLASTTAHSDIRGLKQP